MDTSRFDALTRALATGATRRRLMGFVAGTGTAALIGARSVLRPASAQGDPVGNGSGNATGPNCNESECPQGRIFSESACACVCDIDCPPNHAPDPTSCTCYCTLSDFYVCPREDQVYDDSACLCVCANEDCPGDALLDTDSCLCYCPDGIQCTGNETVDPQTCECVCGIECDQPGKMLDDCLCVCIDDDCPGDAFLNPDTCICSCPPNLVCREGETIDRTTCACVCTLTCDQPGFVLNEGDCECVCDVTDCSDPFILDEQTCTCICPPNIACPENTSLDSTSCECVCPPDSACPSPQVQDPETCLCICPPDVVCRPDQILNPEACVCLCPPKTGVCNDVCVPLCLPTQAYDDDCQCVEVVCPPDRVLTCICACPPGTAECKDTCLPACDDNEVFDDNCQCVCRPNISCAEGRKLDPATCECICETTTCDTGKVLNPTTCECICPDNVACVRGQILDPKTCTCVCEGPPCTGGKVKDRRCRCECPRNIRCKENETLDPATCTCACIPGSLLETIMVPCSGAPILSKMTLKQGTQYTLRASGTCSVAYFRPPAQDADAEYVFNPTDPTNGGWVRDRCPGTSNIELGLGIDDPINNDTIKTPNWGPYNPTHVYDIDFTGKGAPISVNYHDCKFSDNTGFMRVDVLCHGGTPDPICDRTCPSHQVLDAACRCVCPTTVACAPGLTLDPKTCQCVCDVTCAKGETLNPETCICACKPGTVLETVTVPCNGKTITSQTKLAKGNHYILRASGTCTIGPSTDASPIDSSDAEYAFLPSDPNDMNSVVDRCGSAGANIAIGIGVDDASIDSQKSPNWGTYNPSHIYTIDFVGKGATIDLNFHDCVYRENDGSLQVEIICSDDSALCCSGTASCGSHTSAALCCLAPETAYCCCDSAPGAGDGFATCCREGVNCPDCPGTSGWAFAGLTEICSEPGGSASSGC